MQDSKSPPGYLPQLDGLRIFAVLLVAYAHWLPTDYHFNLPLGLSAVEMFFVLSGFLITGILLRCRDSLAQLQSNQANKSQGTKWSVINSFYLRRFLRIFPLYYVILAIIVILNVPSARETLFWTATYLSNFYFYAQGAFSPFVGHLWSLAVEEQFYLIWPWLMIFLPSRWLKPLLIGSIIIAPVVRCILSLATPDSLQKFIPTLPITCLDALGSGSLLAYLGINSNGGKKLQQIGLYIGLSTWLFLMVLDIFIKHPIIKQIEILPMSLAFTWLIGGASQGFTGWVGKVLENQLIVYLGKISYGLYVIHNITPFFYNGIVKRLSISHELAYNQTIRFIMLSIMTVIIASISWFIYEKPLNDLKKYFPYFKKTPA
ncbi:MAG: acyltransferase family protein [Pseudanabaenaceae cyanobacterium]|jgi:peptidoglycan/LPS O-acetylase OafA/YrhL